MSVKYTEIDLDNNQKAAILKYANFFITDAITKKDLSNKRKKWIRFRQESIYNIIGELSYYLNRAEDDATFYLLDELISHLEYYQ